MDTKTTGHPPSPGLAALATCAGLFGLLLTYSGLRHYGFGVDSLAYWRAWHYGFYTGAPGTRAVYIYPPFLAQVLWPLTRLPWPAFAAIWSTGITAALFWLIGPLRWPLKIAALALLSPEIIVGNVWAIFAVVLVLGFQRPQLWAFPLLTKVTSAMGCVWFLVRREWLSLAKVIGCAVIITGISFGVSPGLWSDWVSYLMNHRGAGGGSPPFVLRLPVAVLLAVIGAFRGRPIWLAWAIALGSPVFGTENFVLLAAIPRLRSMSFHPAYVRKRSEPVPATKVAG